MASINRDYHINKNGKIVKSHGDIAIRVLFIVMVLIVVWCVFIILFSRYAESRLEVYADVENKYEIEATLLSIMTSLWGAFISGIATGSVAFLAFWRSARTSRRDELLDKCWQVRPDISVEVEYRTPDARPDDDNYNLTGYRNRRRYVRLVPEESPQTVQFVLAGATYEELLEYKEEALRVSEESGESEYDSFTKEEKIAFTQLLAELEIAESERMAGKGGLQRKTSVIETSRKSGLPVLNCYETAVEAGYDGCSVLVGENCCELW